MEKYPGYPRKPFYYETDKMGIIHHSNYIRWFEEARVDVLTFLGYPFEKIEEMGIMVPVLGVSCTYKEMVYFGDEIIIQPYVSKYTGTRLNFEYQISKNDKLVTTGTSQHCFMSYETNRLVQLKKSQPELHQLFETYFDLTKNETGK
ncbi:acyl-CoA thioesterase [Enterococcus sp. ALS3]|uniref:Acyl-CoA thioesterase n=1 Tax=Enterococcus alishanensis TaxID=1303817 RepID=A0ABS6TE85_9ENTE|nr:thioesterase family protein [Enterococcus alishanensis]MBV7391208.1 acyl-CoA thioesterase [Enterococcus alishanensis]